MCFPQMFPVTPLLIPRAFMNIQSPSFPRMSSRHDFATTCRRNWRTELKQNSLKSRRRSSFVSSTICFTKKNLSTKNGLHNWRVIWALWFLFGEYSRRNCVVSLLIRTCFLAFILQRLQWYKHELLKKSKFFSETPPLQKAGAHSTKHHWYSSLAQLGY